MIADHFTDESAQDDEGIQRLSRDEYARAHPWRTFLAQWWGPMLFLLLGMLAIVLVLTLPFFTRSSQ